MTTPSVEAVFSMMTAKTIYTEERKKHWDQVAGKDRWGAASRFYQQRLKAVFQHLVPPNSRILEVGCGKGDLLASLQPSHGVGVDFSAQMIAGAQNRHPELCFIQADGHDLTRVLEGEVFDFVILSDLINDLWDIQEVLNQIRRVCHPGSRILLNFYSRLWQAPLLLAQGAGLARPFLTQNWLTKDDVNNMLALANFENIRDWNEFLFPFPIPLAAEFLNQVIAKVWPFHALAISNFMVARPAGSAPEGSKKQPTVSVVVPARNEEGNIENIFQRVPEMGSGTEIIFVEGNSTDDTYGAIERAIQQHPERCCKLAKQDGKGKGDAVRKGFSIASGDILMILDADLTMPPEYLPRFYEAIATNKGEFINGVRLVYPMEKEAMRFLNFLGNKFFSLAFTYLLGQPIKDTLCGTKVLWREDYEKIAENRKYFGDFDPFGDFDLLFGAARLSRKVIDLPIRYKERVYGTTNISRWKHGLLLLRMVLFAANRIKFV
jgi:ubiquinone/menaquinone biosynthesis C-methylase UbiE